jgi:tRNA(Arg) A34 adenosine deaminase TadA
MAGKPMIEPAELMRLAIEKCRQGIAVGQSPFGCAIASQDQILAVEHNVVWRTTDITAHAEIAAIRTACKTLGQIHLHECVVATTCEPCPMCMAALHWARVGVVYYGATIADAAAAGFNELQLSAGDVVRWGASGVELKGGLMAAECRELFREWLASPLKQAY